jgi:predicted acyl esterase
MLDVRPVREVEDRITMADGCRLAITSVLPDGDGPWPVLLEALPYRKDDVTASYFAEYARLADEGGFAVARLDLRGTGSSQGIATDEYPEQEQADLAEVIAWLADRAWATGAVGMYGTSYSGFNSLQMAARRPPALRAVCAIFATDDCYSDDVHYTGGILRALDLVDYVTYMVAMNALPPVPAVYGEGWREAWLHRAEQTEPWLLRWLAEQVDGPYWRNGSLRAGTRPPAADQGYERIEAATMIVAGFADGYRNNTFRTFERLRSPKRLLLGPWSHVSPTTARPGPNLDLVTELIAWFGQHLRGDPPSGSAPIQVYVRHPTPPAPDLAHHEGQWWALADWPPPGAEVATLRPDGEGAVPVPVAGDVGVSAWISCAGHLPWGQPDDQRTDEARSLTFGWPAPANGLVVLGQPRLRLRVRVDAPVAFLSAKLADGFPDGPSALVARGALNLTHRDSSTDPAPMEPGRWTDVEVELDATSWRFEPGHEIRLALAGSDWPNLWPPPGAATIEVDRAAVALDLPVVEGEPDLPPPTFAPVDPPPPEPDARWSIEHDVLGRRTRAEVDAGQQYRGRLDAQVADRYRGWVDVSTADPADAGAEGHARFELAWPEATVASEATLSVRSTATDYLVEVALAVSEDGTEVVRRRWSEVIPRRLQ